MKSWLEVIYVTYADTGLTKLTRDELFDEYMELGTLDTACLTLMVDNFDLYYTGALPWPYQEMPSENSCNGADTDTQDEIVQENSETNEDEDMEICIYTVDENEEEIVIEEREIFQGKREIIENGCEIGEDGCEIIQDGSEIVVDHEEIVEDEGEIVEEENVVYDVEMMEAESPVEEREFRKDEECMEVEDVPLIPSAFATVVPVCDTMEPSPTATDTPVHDNVEPENPTSPSNPSISPFPFECQVGDDPNEIWNIDIEALEGPNPSNLSPGVNP